MKNIGIQEARKRSERAIWSRIHQLPRFFVEWWQMWELRRLLELAYNHVPFYKTLWDERGVRPSDIVKLSDIKKLPITSKRLFRQQPIMSLMHDSFFLPHYVWTETSGSTGEPFGFPIRAYSELDLTNVFYEYRFLLWRGENLNDLLASLRVARISDSLPNGYVPSDERLFIPRGLLRDDPSALFRQLKEFGPDVIASRPSMLFELARLAGRMDTNDLPRFKYIMSYGETLYPAARWFIERATSGEVYDAYGLEEVGTIGVECREHLGMHLNEESCIVEVVDGNGVILRDGNTGRIIITRFRRNDVMPFIRYDTGDRGMIMPERCPCGLRARRIQVFGREGIFVTLGGRKFHLSEFEKVLTKLHHAVLGYQIARVGEGDLEIRLVLSDGFSQAADAVAADFKKRFGLSPGVKIVRSIGYNERGKTPIFVDEMDLAEIDR